MQDNRKLLGVRVSPELHKVIKQAALDNDITIQDYIVGLIIADLQIKQNETRSDLWKGSKTEKG